MYAIDLCYNFLKGFAYRRLTLISLSPSHKSKHSFLMCGWNFILWKFHYWRIDSGGFGMEQHNTIFVLY